jgi:siroheme synthase (precorrin-2 oxidase/ferrochelatase)
LNKADFDIVDKLRASDEKNRMFIDKDIDNRTINEKEFEECLKQD